MSHSFFPKEQISIAAHSSLEGKELFYLDHFGKITLNLNSLINIFKRKFEVILTDTNLFSHIDARFEKLFIRNQNILVKHNIDLKRIERGLNHIS
jgi:hypothetical protein